MAASGERFFGGREIGFVSALLSDRRARDAKGLVIAVSNVTRLTLLETAGRATARLG